MLETVFWSALVIEHEDGEIHDGRWLFRGVQSLNHPIILQHPTLDGTFPFHTYIEEAIVILTF